MAWLWWRRQVSNREQQDIPPVKDTELTVKESTYNSEEEVVWPSTQAGRTKTSRIWQLHLMQVFLLAGSQQCKQQQIIS